MFGIKICDVMVVEKVVYPGMKLVKTTFLLRSSDAVCSLHDRAACSPVGHMNLLFRKAEIAELILPSIIPCINKSD